MRKTPTRIAAVAGLLLLGLLIVAVGGWGVLAIMFSGPRDDTLRNGLAAAFALISLTTLIALALRRWRRRALGSYLVVLVVLGVWWHGIEPSNQRDWLADVAELPHATIEGDIITVHNIRNFEYRSETDYTPAWYDKRFDLRKLRGVDLVAVLVMFCFQIFRPFLNLMLWSLIMAITLYPLHLRLRGKLGDNEGRTATLLVVIAIAILMVPIYLLGASLADSVEQALTTVRSGNFQIRPPAESVAGWPLVGKPLHAFWLQASTDLTGAAQKFTPQIKELTITLLGKLAGLGMGLLVFIVALLIAGIFMAYGESGRRSAVEIASRLSGPERGPQITELCTATIRAVAQGVVGIAFIQMLLIGVAFVLKGIPGAGLLALAVLLLGIMQLPATLITVPVIAFVITTEGATTATIVFSVYVFIAGLADNVLKPLLLGRGVNVPMPVVLIGALGGMVTNGVIGLFIGPVVLAVGYQLFWQWVRDRPQGGKPGSQ